MSVNYFHNFPQLARDSGFSLKDTENDGYIDWRFIASIDTNRIIKESDFEKIEECVPHLINSAIGSVLNIRILDPAIGKFYIISQLCIQYLLFCKQFLDKTVNDLRDNIFHGQRNILRLEKSLQKKEDEISLLQKKLHKTENVQQTVYPCSVCTKNFINPELLNFHMNRKHQKPTVDKDSNLIQTIKLELEIKQLKERLNVAERELMDQKQVVTECIRCRNEEAKTQQEIGIQSNIHEEKEVDVKETREKDELRQMMDQQMKHFENWKQLEERKYNLEIQDLRSKLDETIELLRNKEKEEIRRPIYQVADKCLETETEAIPEATKSQKIQEENIWKTRCQEMETMYQESQKRTNETIDNLEKNYNKKIKEIENSVNLMKESVVKHPPTTSKAIQIEEIKAAPRKIMIHPKTPEISEDSESERENLDDFKSSNLQITIESSESEEENNKKIVEVQAIIERPSSSKIPQLKLKKKLPKISKTVKTSKSEEILFPPAKPATEILKGKSTEDLKKLMEVPEGKSQQASRIEAFNLFKKRLNFFGINENQKKIDKNELSQVNEEMVRKRDELKKKYKSFFITRKSIQAKLNQLMKDRHPSPDPSLEKPAKPRKSVRKSPVKENLEEIIEDSSEIPEIFQGYLRELREDPPKDRQIVEAEVEKHLESPKVQENKENVEDIKSPRNFRENLEKMLQKQLEQSTLTLKPTLSDHEDTSREYHKLPPLDLPKIVLPNKKKVLFNLDTIEEDVSKNIQKPAEINSDSDWNISSFEDDDNELKK